MSKSEREEMITVLAMRRKYSLEFLYGLDDAMLLRLYEREI